MHSKCDKMDQPRCAVKGKDGKRECKSHYPMPFGDTSSPGEGDDGRFPTRPTLRQGSPTKCPLARATQLCSGTVDGYALSSPSSTTSCHIAYNLKRPPNGRTSLVSDEDRKKAEKVGGKGAVPFTERDNRYCVPHNIFLLILMGAHVNVQPVNSTQCIICIFKYLFKDQGLPTAMAFLNKHAEDGLENECLDHLLGIYMGGIEAAGILLGTKMVEIYPPILRLAVHLDGKQTMCYSPAASPREIKEQAEKSKSTLMAFFDCNCFTDPGSVWFQKEFLGFNTLLYTEVPEYFSYCPQDKKFKLRPGFFWDATRKKFLTTDRARAAKKRLLALAGCSGPVRKTKSCSVCGSC